MISAAKLKLLSSINADELTEMLLEDGYDCTDEPFINTHFQGVYTNGINFNFIYEAQYVHVDGGLQFARIIVTYNTNTEKVSAEYAS